MTRFFQTVGILALICVSFFVTEKTVQVVKEYDDVMIAIKQKKESYEIKAVDATVKDNTVRPGKKGKTIDVNKSYSKMKQYGKFNESLLEFKETKPEVSIVDHKDAYVIGGNASDQKISLVFLIEKDDDYESLLTILEDKDIKGNFFVNSEWLENHNELMLEWIKKGHNIGNLSENRDYNSASFPWMNTIIEKIGHQKTGYCYLESPNEDSLKLCSYASNYTIMPSIVIKQNLTKEVKDSIANGGIISITPSSSVLKELPVMIQTILSKGYQIVPLNELLTE